MITINIYQPGKIDLTIEFPSTWNELRPEEIIFIAKTLLTESETATVKAFILKFIIEHRATSPLSSRRGAGGEAASRRGAGGEASPLRTASLPKDWLYYLDPEQVAIDCLPLLDFIFKENNLTKTPNPVTIKIPKSQILNQKIQNPKSKNPTSLTFHPQPFNKITCAEYEDAEVAANLFAAEPSEDSLATLAAILFRPLQAANQAATEVGPDHAEGPEQVEHYIKFNLATNQYYTYKAELKIKYFKKLPPEQLYAIFIWYAGNRSELPKMFPHVFSGGGSDEKDLMAFTKCIHSAAGPKNGTRQQVRLTELFEFMLEMDEEARKAKELEEEYEKMKRQ